MYHPKIIIPPIVEPITPIEAMEWCRMGETLNDLSPADVNSLTSIVRGAREMFENDLGRTFHETTLEYAIDGWPCDRAIELPRATPLQSVISFTYVDQDGAATVWNSSNYSLDTYSTPGRVYLRRQKAWPSTTLDQFNAIRIRYVAGKLNETPGDEVDVPFPECLKIAMRLIVSHWNENREATTVGTLMESKELALGVNELLTHYKSYGF